MNEPDDGARAGVIAATNPWPGLAAAISAATIVGITYGGVVPLLSLNLEHLGVDPVWNGLMGAMPSAAMICLSAFIPLIVRRLVSGPGSLCQYGTRFRHFAAIPRRDLRSRLVCVEISHDPRDRAALDSQRNLDKCPRTCREAGHGDGVLWHGALRWDFDRTAHDQLSW